MKGSIRNDFLAAGTPGLYIMVTGDNQPKCGRGSRGGEHPDRKGMTLAKVWMKETA